MIGEDDGSSIMKKMSPYYTFKGYMSFMLYGPFVEPSRRLTIFSPSDVDKSLVNGRTAARGNKKTEKSLIRNTSFEKRGFTNENLIDLTLIDIQAETLEQKKDESKLVAMTMSISSLNTQIDSATRRAERMCKEYDEKNDFGKM